MTAKDFPDAEWIAKHMNPPNPCAHCGCPSAEHPVACFGCQTCMFTCDHYICLEYIAAKEGHLMASSYEVLVELLAFIRRGMAHHSGADVCMWAQVDHPTLERWEARATTLKPVASGAEHVIAITYINHRGEKSDRQIIPRQIRFASSEWHPEPQWLMDAFDVGKQQDRSFALADMIIKPRTP